MFSTGRFALIVGLGVVLAIAGHFSQSSILGHEKEFKMAEAENEKPFTLIRAMNIQNRNLDSSIQCEVDQKPCDGFTEHECSQVCSSYGLPASKCSGCVCLCDVN